MDHEGDTLADADFWLGDADVMIVCFEGFVGGVDVILVNFDGSRGHLDGMLRAAGDKIVESDGN